MSIDQEYIVALNGHAPNNRAAKSMKQKSKEKIEQKEK